MDASHSVAGEATNATPAGRSGAAAMAAAVHLAPQQAIELERDLLAHVARGEIGFRLAPVADHAITICAACPRPPRALRQGGGPLGRIWLASSGARQRR